MQIVVEALANAPPKAVFRAAADIAAWPRFMSAVETVEVLTPGAVTLGTRFRQTRSMFGRRASEEMTVASLEPPRRLVLTAHNHGTAYRLVHEFALAGTGTRVSLTFSGQPATLMARLLAPLGAMMQGAVRRQLTADLADLAREAERRHRDPMA
jgi:uncharacterized protein YndB with AHSA1/START domain